MNRSEKLETLSRKIKRDYWCSPSKRLKDPREMVAQIHIGRQSDLGGMVCERWQNRKGTCSESMDHTRVFGFPALSCCPDLSSGLGPHTV